MTYDSRCSYSLAAPSGSPAQWSPAPHAGEITLPNGAKIPPAPNALNAVMENRNFVVMSLPSIWRPVEKEAASKAMHLWVFEANARAIDFYLRQGGTIAGRDVSRIAAAGRKPVVCVRWPALTQLATP